MNRCNFERRSILILIWFIVLVAPSSAQSNEPQLSGPKPLHVAEDDKLRPATAPPASGETLQQNRRQLPNEASASAAPYYNNYFDTFRLGPGDVISITVFNEPRYSLPTVTVPPDGKIDYPLIGQVFTTGRTIEDIGREVKLRIGEYITDPSVSVNILQIRSAQVNIIGEVGRPGPLILTRRMTVFEALAEAGGITPMGKGSEVAILRQQPDGSISVLPFNFDQAKKGRGFEQNAYLVPGDTIVVQGNLYQKLRQVSAFTSIAGLIRFLFFAF